MNPFKYAILASILFTGCATKDTSVRTDNEKPNYGGIYPHLAYYNDEGECGTGAVVPWQDKLWIMTYGPHLPWGSSDKLYEIDDTLGVRIRPESIGGTAANRMIHRESGQLIIGPYFIDSLCNVRTLSYADAQGRYTGMCRHLTDPANKVYIATMEEGLYEVDVNSLKHHELYPDANKGSNHDDTGVNPQNNLLPGAHGKGLYSGQNVIVFSNNGEATPEALEKFDIPSGCLAEWDGKDWTVIRRNQFTEVTGPGDIYGSDVNAPIYALGWDYKSIILAMRDDDKWSFFRLPKASNSYDGAHGWNTEWPRIREVGSKDNPMKLMTMHGMFWEFPQEFNSDKTSGIKPLSAYLKVIGDFSRWNDNIVFGCDDTAKKEFLNKRRIKGNLAGPGQSNSNLWFLSPDRLTDLGPTNASGALWLNENIEADSPSDPLLFNGWAKRCAWLKNNGRESIKITFEINDGSGNWSNLRSVEIASNGSCFVPFANADNGEWIRIRSDKATNASAIFVFSDKDERTTEPSPIFDGLTSVKDSSASTGLLYCLGNNARKLGIATDNGYYELDGNMQLVSSKDSDTSNFIKNNMSISNDGMEITDGSVLIVDDEERRWRLPLGSDSFTPLSKDKKLRICREVSTERDLLNCHGTFYELPAENADGFAKIRPISSHNFQINDFGSYRGMLVMSGITPGDHINPRIVTSNDGKLSLWCGAIDDLWELGKPVGHGGPWIEESIKANEYSDPYLIGFYDQRILNISHKSTKPVKFTVEVDPIGDGTWVKYAEFEVVPNDSFFHRFPDEFQARWIRFKTDTPCVATTWLDYK